VDLGLLNLLQ